MRHKMEVFHTSFYASLITQETRIFLRVKAVTINYFELWPIYQFGHHDTRDGIQKMLGTEFSTVYEMQEQSFFLFQFEDYQTNTTQYVLQEIIKTSISSSL